MVTCTLGLCLFRLKNIIIESVDSYKLGWPEHLHICNTLQYNINTPNTLGGIFLPIHYALLIDSWNMRMAAIKAMAANFAAFDHPIYQWLISNHVVDTVQALSNSSGGFVVSLSGRRYHSVRIDEAHEMEINKQCKQAISVHQRSQWNPCAI